jgi:hypothetical protein
VAVGATTAALVKTAVAVGSAVKARKDEQANERTETKNQNESGYKYGSPEPEAKQPRRAGAAPRTRANHVRLIVWAPLVLGFFWALRK